MAKKGKKKRHKAKSKKRTKRPPQGTTKRPPQGTTKRPPQGTTKRPPQGTTKKPPQGTLERPPEGTTKSVPGFGAGGNYKVALVIGEPLQIKGAELVTVLANGELVVQSKGQQWFVFAPGVWKTALPEQPEP